MSDDGPLPPTPVHAVKSPRQSLNPNDETNQHLVAREINAEGKGLFNKKRHTVTKVESFSELPPIVVVSSALAQEEEPKMVPSNHYKEAKITPLKANHSTINYRTEDKNN